MQNKLHLTVDEISLIELALEERINYLKNKFYDEPSGFIHPAEKYEALHDKLYLFNEQLTDNDSVVLAATQATAQECDATDV